MYLLHGFIKKSQKTPRRDLELATLAYQIKNMMHEQGIRKTEMATRMKTSRSALDRLLNEESCNITITTIIKAASVLGKRIELSLVDKNP
jgi:antitoxin HicB